jgi:hypothetical protein
VVVRVLAEQLHNFFSSEVASVVIADTNVAGVVKNFAEDH